MGQQQSTSWDRAGGIGETMLSSSYRYKESQSFFEKGGSPFAGGAAPRPTFSRPSQGAAADPKPVNFWPPPPPPPADK